MRIKLLPTFFLSLSLSLSFTGWSVASDRTVRPATNALAKAASPVAADTASAIKALGPNATKKQISSLVFRAVRSSPENVLFIVNAAARVAPPATVPGIVTAAVAAVPNPWKRVAYRRTTTRTERDYKSTADGKSGPDNRQARGGGPNVDLGGRQHGDPRAGTTNGNLGPGDPNGPGGPGSFGVAGLPGGPGNAATLGDLVPFGDPSAFSDPGAFGDPGDPGVGGNGSDGRIFTLAEAIAFAAFNSQPGLNFPSLQTAVNIALLTDPASLLREVQSSRAISGVGDAGISNYANEPLRTPTQPAVSQ